MYNVSCVSRSAGADRSQDQTTGDALQFKKVLGHGHVDVGSIGRTLRPGR